jgi:hypothetical protein
MILDTRGSAMTGLDVEIPRRQGQRPSISSTSVKLRKVRTTTRPASSPRLTKVRLMAINLTMSAATRIPGPSQNERPRLIFVLLS